MDTNLNDTWEDTPESKVKPPKDIFHETVFSMWEGGIRDLEEIRNETGYSKSYIRMLLRDRGYEVTTVTARSPQEIEGICNDYNNMENSIRSILTKWNISNATLYAILASKEVPVRRGRKTGRQLFVDRAIEMYKNDAILRDIIAETGIGAVELYQRLAEQGVSLRRASKVADVDSDNAVAMYQKGVHVIDIQVGTGITPAQLYKELAVRKIPLRRGIVQVERIDKAVDMYVEGKSHNEIYLATKISPSVLHRNLHYRGITKRGSRAQGDKERALELYDKGATAREILRGSKMTQPEFLILLKKRGKNLRSGLPVDVTPQHQNLALKLYQGGTDVDTIEFETMITRTMLYAILKQKGIAIRP